MCFVRSTDHNIINNQQQTVNGTIVNCKVMISSTGRQQPSDDESTPSWKRWVDELQMQPHPEGGYYAETYRSPVLVPTARGERNASTAIYFLMTPNTFSRLLRIRSDECWHFYAGEPLEVVELVKDNDDDEHHPNTDSTNANANKSGYAKVTKVGMGPGCVPQYMVKADTWFGSYPSSASEFSLVGCTVAPGFDFADFELASRAKLLQEFPAAADIIIKLTEGLP